MAPAQDPVISRIEMSPRLKDLQGSHKFLARKLCALLVRIGESGQGLCGTIMEDGSVIVRISP